MLDRPAWQRIKNPRLGIELKSAGSRQFFDYYQKIGDGFLPKRASFRPEDIPRLLSHIIIGHHVDDDHMTYRLVGSHVTDHFGVNPTGKNFYDILSPDLVEKWKRHATECQSTPKGVYLDWVFQNEQGAIYDVENIVLPFLDNEGRVKYFIGYCAFLEMRGWGDEGVKALSAPSWLEFAI